MNALNPQDLIDQTVLGSDNAELGKVHNVLLDDATGQPEFIRRRLTAMIPMGRFGSVEDVAAAAAFLASDEAAFISGVALPIDGAMLCQ